MEEKLYTLEEAMEKLNKSKNALTTKFSRTQKRLSDSTDIYIERFGKGDATLYSIKYGEYWNQPKIEGYPILPLSGNCTNLFGKKIHYLTPLYRTKDDSADFENSKSIWLCRCDCGKYVTLSTGLLQSDTIKSCGCKSKQLLTNKKFGKLTVITKLPYKVEGCRSNLWLCKCDCGKERALKTSEINSGKILSCGCKRVKSLGEKKIEDILIENSIDYVSQKSFDSCRFPDTNALLFFDFYLPDYSCCIEYDGEQHFKPVVFGKMTEEESKIQLEKTKVRDSFKNQWCKDNNILLIRIPYHNYKNLTLNDILPKTSPFILNI